MYKTYNKYLYRRFFRQGYILFFLFQWMLAHAENDYKNFYINRYDQPNFSKKMTDDKGNGFKELYGTRNFRSVLKGIYYRGGANNTHLKKDSRSNSNPLTTMGLTNLCKEGFQSAIYLYKTGFEKAPKSIQCQGIRGNNTIEYLQLNAFQLKERTEILQLIHQKLLSTGPENRGPIYIHCWNGWHASGLIAALSLRQFCDYTGLMAIQYWDDLTDGNNKDPRFKSVRKIISDYKIDPKLSISVDLKKDICF